MMRLYRANFSTNAERVAASLGVPKRRVYEAALRVRAAGGPQG